MTQQTNNIKKYKTLVCKQREGKRDEENPRDKDKTEVHREKGGGGGRGGGLGTGLEEEETEYDFYLLNMTNKAVFKESTRQDTEHK